MKAYFERQISWRGMIIPVWLVVWMILCQFIPDSISFLLLVLWMLLFYKMDTFVDDTHVKIVFGLGLCTKKIPLADIRSVSCVDIKYRWYLGSGIKIGVSKSLYWAKNTDVVELKLKGSKRVIQIGSKDVEQLKQAIEAHL